MNDPLLSLCIPTNGIVEWVKPVLESIYQDNNLLDDYEVIVTDNGKNSEFEKEMADFSVSHRNFIYRKTNAVMFQNQIEAFKLARGQLIKFINHRMILIPGSIGYLIQFVRDNILEKPVVYFSNGVLGIKDGGSVCNSFDSYVKTLSYWSSWSAGTAIWKSDFCKMDLSKEFNKLFPHTDIIFFRRDDQKYIVCDKKLLEEIPSDISKKGKYDLFNAFAVEYPNILNELKQKSYITEETFHFVINRNFSFVCELYYNYCIKKQPCSYDLSGYSRAIGKYYSDIRVKIRIPYILMRNIFSKLKRLV